MTDSVPDSEKTADTDWVRRFSRLTALNILANITVPLVGLVDTAMLGHLDDIRFLGGAALGALVFDYLFWTLGFLRMSTTGLTAQAVGRRHLDEAERILLRSAAIALAFGLALLALREPLADTAFSLLSGDGVTEGSGRDYFYARLWGAPAALLNLAFFGWFLGREESRVALVMTVVANGANLVLDYIFILRLDWAAAGAGYATALSQYLMLGIAVLFYWPRRQKLGTWQGLLDGDRLRELLSLNRDIMIRSLCLTTTFALFTDFSSRLGPIALAANTLHLRLISLGAFFIDGAAFAVESLTGIFIGEGRRQALNRLVGLALLTGVAFASFFALIPALFPAAVFGLLTSHHDVVELATSLRWWLIPVLWIGSAAYVFDGLFLGLTAGAILRNSMLLSVALFLPPALLSVDRGDVHLLWLSLSLFMVARVSTLALAWKKL